MAVLKKFVEHAKETEVEGERFLRVTDAETVKEFFGLYKAYRLPLDEGRAHVIGQRKRIEYPIAPAPLRSYLFT